MQGLSLPWLIRRFNLIFIEDTPDSDASARAQVVLAGAAIARLQSLEGEFVTPVHWEIAGRLRAEYEQQQAHYRDHLDDVPTDDAQPHEIGRELRRKLIDATRRALVAMRESGEIPDSVYHDLEYDIDLGESRLR